ESLEETCFATLLRKLLHRLVKTSKKPATVFQRQLKNTVPICPPYWCTKILTRLKGRAQLACMVVKSGRNWLLSWRAMESISKTWLRRVEPRSLLILESQLLRGKFRLSEKMS